ncbi:uncharacterized protein LOC130745107 [Lotus japonicus]|uniref:uncharacterized protein LOC130745107 n=1 Tax=Lotus japonicus TaxID=34305 RepID=UPI002587BEBC|nr:uncharacterized protein LOC130745107 [Lotus japonicus]
MDEAWRKIAFDHDAFLRALSAEDDAQGHNYIRSVWKPPPQGSIKLNTDGSWKQGSNQVGGGGLFRGPDGVWVRGFVSLDTGDNAFLAEVRALRDGLHIAWAQGYKDIIVEMDCKEVLKELTNTASHSFCPMLGEIASLLRQQWKVHVQWIPRDCNMAADCLAHIGGTASSSGLHILERPPVEVEPFILRDSFSCL